MLFNLYFSVVIIIPIPNAHKGLSHMLVENHSSPTADQGHPNTVEIFKWSQLNMVYVDIVHIYLYFWCIVLLLRYLNNGTGGVRHATLR